MSKLFNVGMSSMEIGLAFFKATDGKTKEERDRIFNEFAPIHNEILDKEFELAQQGWLFD